MKITPSILNIKACASLQEEIEQDLKQEDPIKGLAQLLDENNEEKTSNQKENTQETSQQEENNSI